MTQQQWGQPPGGGWQQGPWPQPPQGQVGGPWPSPYGQSPYGQSQFGAGRGTRGFGGQGFGGQGFGGPGFGGQQLGQPYAPSPFGPPPRRRRHPLRSLFFGLVLVTLVGIVGLVGANGANPTPQVSYQNTDYRVPPPDKTPPPLPVPQTYQEAERLVTSNAFYRQNAANPVQCDAQPINVATADDAQLKSHFEALMECILRVWQPPVTGAGFQIVRPTVTIYGKELTTKCGKSEVNAFYCSADQQVYFSRLLPDYVTIVKRNKWAADVVMAHEFGHALQARTGILMSAHALGQNSGSKSEELEMSRRLETQADCFAGMFTNAVATSLGITNSDVQGIQDTFVAVGDDTITGNPNIVGNHGLARSREAWGTTGLGTSAVGKCNTFTASRSQVR